MDTIETQNKTTTNQINIPKTPTGTRMSQRGKILILALFMMLSVFIIWAIFSFAPKNIDTPYHNTTTINKNQLGNQQQQGRDLVNSLKVAAGSSSLSSNPTTAITGANIFTQNNASEASTNPNALGVENVAANTPVFASTLTPPNQTAAFVGGQPQNGTSDTQNSPEQIRQNGMQSGLTPNGFSDSSNHATILAGDGNNKNNNEKNNNSAISADERDASALASLSQSVSNINDPSLQAEKTTFIENQNNNADSLEQGVQTPVSHFMLMAGSIIPATLITGINSDLPGQIQAMVTQNIYDSKTGNSILIPQGSRLIGVYDSQVAYGQSRVLMVWTRIIFPNDQYLDLQNMPGADLSGFAGIADQVNNHYLRIYGSALLMSLFSAGMQLSQPNSNNANGAPNNQQIFAAALGQNIGQLATQMAEKNLSIQPTINIRPGDQFNVLVTRDVPFAGPYDDKAANQITLANSN